MSGYVELQVLSNFSFLEGASHPEELAVTAAALGHRALAVADRNTLAGIVRAHQACKQAGIRLVVGARLDLIDAPSLLCFPRDRAAYGRLSRLLTTGRRRATKGQCDLTLADVAVAADGQLFVALPPVWPDAAFARDLSAVRARLGPVYLAAQMRYDGRDTARLPALAALATTAETPLVATNDVLCHSPRRRPLVDLVTCIREHCTVEQAGWRLAAHAERHLKPAAEMARLFKDDPQAVARTVAIADQCRFSLDELRYEYPDEVAEGQSPQETLARLTWTGAETRYPDGVPDTVVTQLRHELTLIDQLGYAPYFLTVHDIVRFARDREILCQGRGSAANSAVCYVLGITAVDPARADLLFERFVSPARNEPPDIDVDFEHERREEVIQYIYENAMAGIAPALAATVICVPRRAAPSVMSARRMGSVDRHGCHRSAGQVDLGLVGPSRGNPTSEQARQAGLDPTDPSLVAQQLDLLFVNEIHRLSPPPVAARGWVCHIPRTGLAQLVPDRERGHGGSHRHSMGQRRPRGTWGC